MIPSRDYIYRILIFVLSISFPAKSLSQEKPKNDTLDFATYGYGFRSTDELNFELIVAASNGNVVGIRWLIRQGADPDTRTYENITPLMYAVANNRLEAVRTLLTYDVNINIMTNNSETPLLTAVKNGNVEIAETLIRDSADIGLADRYGATPLHYAAIYGYHKMVDMLLYYDASFNTKTNDGTTPLMAAVWAGYPDIADILLQNGENPEERDNNGFTPFLVAAQNGDTITMEMLLNRNVDLYEVNNYKYNALDISIKLNHVEAASYLLRRGNNWTTNAHKPINPYLIATKYARKQLTALLEKNNIPNTYNFGFDQVALAASFKACLHDYFTCLGLSFKEPLINAGIFAGLDFKPGYTRLLIRDSENQFHQYMDRRSNIYAGLFKDLAITDYALKGNWSFSGSLAFGYTFGDRLKGTTLTPDNKVRLIPAIAFKWTINNLNFISGVDIIKSEFHKVGPVWLRLGVSYNFFFDNIRAPGKNIKWY